MASYVCPNCEVDYGYSLGLAIHKELGCDEEGNGDANYCCGKIYEDGESTCSSCGEPL